MLFDEGGAAKNKLSAEQMAQRMKDETIDGEFYFTPNEYLEPRQIRGLIAQLMKNETMPQPDLKRIALSEEDSVIRNTDEICFSIFDEDCDNSGEE